MKRKAQYIKFMLLITWAILLVYIMMVTAIFTSGFIKKETDVRDAEARILANRILYSPNGISYTETDLARVYPGFIDISRIETSVLESALHINDNQIMAVKVTLRNSAGVKIKEAIYNELWYHRWLPLVGKRGSAAASQIVEKRYVQIYENGASKGSGMLEMQILIPNA